MYSKYFPTYCCFLLILISYNCSAYHLRGRITDNTGDAVPNTSVFIENSTHGVASNLKGEYFLELKNGAYTIIFQALGYEKKSVTVNINNSNKTVNVILQESSVLLDELGIVADKKDPAYEIIKNAIASRGKYKKQVEGYSCNTYIKSSLEKEYMKRLDEDNDSLPKVLTKEKMNFIESYSQTHYRYPNQYKEIKSAYKDLSDKHKGSVSISISTGSGDDNYYETDLVNLNLFKTNISEAEFNFYHNTVDVASLGGIPYISPIGAGAFLSYKYKLIESFYENKLWINKIEVIPRRSQGALFKGMIYIVDSLWSIKAVDLEINKAGLYHFNYFKIIQQYDLVNDSIWMLGREEFLYNSKEGKKQILGNTIIVNSDYQINPTFPKNFFNNELRTILDDAYDKDSTFWAERRPITLKDDEIRFVHIQDSIIAHHKSEQYLKQRDSIFNRIDIWDVLLNGIGHHNSFKKKTVYFNSIVNSVMPFTVGGYRQAFGGGYEKEWSKANSIEVSYRLDYGFKNEDLKGFVDLDYLYKPKKFGRVYVSYGNEYDFINNYESFEATFSRGNYINVEYYELGHEMELVNGIYLDVSGEYVEKRSIEGIKLATWSNDVFGENNAPREFDDYNELLLDVYLKLRYKQKYYTEPFKKVNLGSKYPKLRLHYKKAIPNILDSNVDFDFLELNIKDDIKLGTMGISKFNVYTGMFLRGDQVKFTDHKFFRGSDDHIFSSPLKSFQLLGPSISTMNKYLQLHYLHHFNGTLLNKIPFVNKLKLETVGGGGVLLIEDNNFRHVEIFAGLEKPFKIRRQLFKIGVYYVGADSNFSELDATFKIGVDFFNSFTNSWSY